jgi:hypothetical protein
VNKRYNWMKAADTLVERGVFALRATKSGQVMGECLVGEGGHRVASWLERMDESGAFIENFRSEAELLRARKAA